MRRIREIILDFTPLLDITLIILFYFILFSHLGAAEAQQRAEQAESAAAEAQAAAAEILDTAEAMQAQAKQQLDILSVSSGAEAAEAMQRFAEGKNLRLRLHARAGSWELRVMQGDAELTVLSGKDIAPGLAAALSDAGYRAEDVILCEFVYSADEAGSYQAYQTADSALDALRKDYPHLYISETDLSK